MLICIGGWNRVIYTVSTCQDPNGLIVIFVLLLLLLLHVYLGDPCLRLGERIAKGLRQPYQLGSLSFATKCYFTQIHFMLLRNALVGGELEWV